MSELVLADWMVNLIHACILLVFIMGLFCFFLRKRYIPQLVGLKLMLQSVSLGLVLSGWEKGDLHLSQSMVISALVSLGVIRILLNIHDNVEATIEQLFTSYPLLLKYIVANLLYNILVVVGLIALIVPGIIFAIRLEFYGFFIVDEKCGIIESFSRSWELTQGIANKLFLFNIIATIIIGIGALLLGIGLLVAVPVVMLAMTFIYRKIKKQEEEREGNRGNSVVSPIE